MLLGFELLKGLEVVIGFLLMTKMYLMRFL